MTLFCDQNDYYAYKSQLPHIVRVEETMIPSDALLYLPTGKSVSHCLLDCQDTSSFLSLRVIGTPGLFDGSGRQLPLRNQKAFALLALLAQASHGVRHRTWLRDKLWSTCDAEHGAQNLRQTLADLRRAIGPGHETYLKASRLDVRLELNCWRIDWLTERHKEAVVSSAELHAELLEGLDVDDPEFEDWLRHQRQARWDWLESRKPSSPARPSALLKTVYEPLPESLIKPVGEAETRPQVRSHRLGLGLLPSECETLFSPLVSAADLLVEAVARSIQEVEPIDVFDFRDEEARKFSTGIPEANAPDWLIRGRVNAMGSMLSLTLLVYRVPSMTLVWSNTMEADQSDVLGVNNAVFAGFVNQNVDRLLHALFGFAGRDGIGGDQGNANNFLNINMIFANRSDLLSRAEGNLTSALGSDFSGMSEALLAYIVTFDKGEGLRPFSEARLLDCKRFIRESEEKALSNSLALACMGHASAFVLGDLDAAGEHLSNAVRINPSQAFVWDHLALLSLYSGDLGSAHAASRRAVELGAFSPLRFSYETTFAMVSALLGDHRAAIAYGERALRRRPQFGAVRRYLALSYAACGQAARARDMASAFQRSGQHVNLRTIQMEFAALHDIEQRGRVAQIVFNAIGTS